MRRAAEILSETLSSDEEYALQAIEGCGRSLVSMPDVIESLTSLRLVEKFATQQLGLTLLGAEVLRRISD